jgi:hypothetical protein
MAICTTCGAILNNDDRDHVCKPENIPAKGKEHIPSKTVVDAAPK